MSKDNFKKKKRTLIKEHSFEYKYLESRLKLAFNYYFKENFFSSSFPSFILPTVDR